MKQRESLDDRINVKHPVWLEYAIFLTITLCLTGGQAMIFYSYVDINLVTIPPAFIFANIGYWGLMTLILCFVTTAIRKRTFLHPMRKLGNAARQVARGDFSVNIEPLRNDGKKDYAEVMFEDFNRMVEELNTIETMKTDFILNVSHEIKTPLSIIQNYAAALQKEHITAEQRQEYTSTIITASQKLNSLVSNILKLSKLENQRIVPTFEEFDLCGQLAECALSFEDLWERKDITFSADIDDRAVILADREMLGIVWNNLLSNAVKFTESGGHVSLTQTSNEDSVTVIIADTGCGMSEKTLNHIFDKFYQGETSRSQDGNGLGLALALRVVELMGGQISVKSDPGVGSVFTVMLKVEYEA